MDRVEETPIVQSKLRGEFDERTRRLWAAREAAEHGRGGIAAMCRVTGLAYETVARGRADLASNATLPPGRVRRSGAGRKRVSSLDRTLQGDLEALIDPGARFDPESPLRWTSKSARQLATALRASGHRCSDTAVRGLLHEMGYRLQANRRSKEGAQHPDRDGQFEHVSARVKRQLAAGEPAIVVDTKRRESIHVARASGPEWHPEHERVPANVRAFMSRDIGPLALDGGADPLDEWRWRNAGISDATAAYAAATVACWYRLLGSAAFPKAKTLLVIVDEEGDHGPILRLWERGLQDLADESGLAISVCHLPPGTSRWTRLEHRMFSFNTGISDALPRLHRAAVVSEISKTPGAAAPLARYGIDRTVYRNGTSAKAAELATVRIERDGFYGDWNYTIRPL